MPAELVKGEKKSMKLAAKDSDNGGEKEKRLVREIKNLTKSKLTDKH